MGGTQGQRGQKEIGKGKEARKGRRKLAPLPPPPPSMAPSEWIVREGSTRRCSLCGPIGGSDKAVSQHLRSITHKRALASLAAPAHEPAPPASPAERSAEVCELLAVLCIGEAAEQAAMACERYAEARCKLDAASLPVRGWLPPPLLRNPAKECPQLDTPFLTQQTGAIPTVPSSLEECLAAYFSGQRHEFPKVDVAERGTGVCSWAEARRTLLAAKAAGERYWCTFVCQDMQHPRWWPKAAQGARGLGPGPMSVPLYDQVIVGSGRTGIGIHRDVHGPHRRCVCTCLSLAKGVKHVMLLPPSCAESAVLNAYGHETARCSTKQSPEEAHEAARTQDGACESTLNMKHGAGECAWFGDDDTFPKSPPADLLRRIALVGGYFFSMHASNIDIAEDVHGQPRVHDDNHKSRASGGDYPCLDMHDDGAVLALYIPAGWFHWLLGDSDWHVIFGGSFFPRGS